MTKWSLPARSSQSGAEMDNDMKDKTCEEKERSEKNECAMETGWGVTGEHERPQ